MATDGTLSVGVIAGGPSEEREVSLETGKNVTAALRSRGLLVLEVEILRDGRWRFADAPEPISLPAALARLTGEIDAVYIALHGTFGEDGTLQGVLDGARVPYVGSGVAASALAMDKILARRIATTFGLEVAPGIEAGPGAAEEVVADVTRRARELSFPVFIKPSGSGSSVGVSRVEAPDGLEPAVRAALAESPRVLVESGVAGRELSCPVVGDAGRGSGPLPVIEIAPKDQAFFDYEAKYTPGATEEICPAPLEPSVAARVQSAAKEVHDAFSCRSLSRCDFILAEDGRLVFLELNTLPGMAPTSLFPQAVAAAGLDLGELMERWVRDAMAAAPAGP